MLTGSCVSRLVVRVSAVRFSPAISLNFHVRMRCRSPFLVPSSLSHVTDIHTLTPCPRGSPLERSPPLASSPPRPRSTGASVCSSDRVPRTRGAPWWDPPPVRPVTRYSPCVRALTDRARSPHCLSLFSLSQSFTLINRSYLTLSLTQGVCPRKLRLTPLRSTRHVSVAVIVSVFAQAGVPAF